MLSTGRGDIIHFLSYIFPDNCLYYAKKDTLQFCLSAKLSNNPIHISTKVFWKYKVGLNFENKTFKALRVLWYDIK